jgi:hypothetical protein
MTRTAWILMLALWFSLYANWRLSNALELVADVCDVDLAEM